jgi:hypothetical protein
MFGVLKETVGVVIELKQPTHSQYTVHATIVAGEYAGEVCV